MKDFSFLLDIKVGRRRAASGEDFLFSLAFHCALLSDHEIRGGEGWWRNQSTSVMSAY